ncbi:PREDICTED: uncharacterized protein LOC109467341 [Branchiostoma belcheri]|uniref:Uncharacterized protein LOC109467341 n=1 Tax=Branchiostoma belcheri TaxID=7741 RepID=A0A6P4YFU6_BRABE|nr:PREDICTED: uncharacterized protein LOC109467341 [Branchiostoma belcheri]
MALLSPRNVLYHKISENLTREEVRSLRSLVTLDGHLPRGKIQDASAQDIFIMLEQKLILSKGNLGFLVDILTQLSHRRLADEVREVERKERRELEGNSDTPRPGPSGTKVQTTQATRPRPVFISYCSDPYIDKKRTKEDIKKHVKLQKDRVKALSDELRRNGVESMLDQYEDHSPPAFWTKWTEEQIEKSDYVLMVCTPNYLECIRGRRNEETTTESGARFQGMLFYSQLADSKSHGKFLPVFFDNVDRSLVPTCLKGAHFYGPLGESPKYGQEKFDQLLCKIVGRIPKHKIPPPIGKVPTKFKSRKKET